jgi:hypothetical protein
MALIIADRVKESSTTTGTGTITLGGAVSGYQSFATIGNGNQCYYTIVNLAVATEWEVGVGTYTASGTTLSRDTVLDSSTGAKVSFSAGNKEVFVTYPADRSVSQADVGTAPNEVPLNQYLGSMAYLDADNISFSNVGTNAAEQNLAVNKLSVVTISADTTLTTTVPKVGSTAFVIVITSGASSRTVTFGTGFKSTGTLSTGTDAGRRFVFQFISDGANLVEVSRTAAITY